MKLFVTIFLLFVAGGILAQTPLVPGVNAVEKQWLKNEDSKLTWYQVNGNSRKKFGEIETSIRVDSRNVVVVRRITIDTMPSAWIDTTIASVNDLSPVYHSSINKWRSLVLRYNRVITGVHNDKVNNEITNISDSTTEGTFFDSQLYPQLIRWLPLRAGYKQDIAIYDYNPAVDRIGKMKASIVNTVPEKLKGRAVWVVTVKDDMQPGAVSTYYIGVADRRLWRVEVENKGEKWIME
jgi:hypothetical protein